MTSKIPTLFLIVLVVLVLSACSTASSDVETSSVTGGGIELAVSETCAKGSGPQCVSINDENVLLPLGFERAGVEDTTVLESDGQNTVDVRFSEEGAVVFHALTAKAAQAGDAARLVLKVGDDVLASVIVEQVLEGDHVQIGLAPDDSAQEVVDLIRGG